MWLASLDLSESSRESLISGASLNDQHMIAAIMLVKRNFPKIGGLQNPVRNKSKSKGFSPQPEGSIQILHCFNQWVATCYLDGTVKLYDCCMTERMGFLRSCNNSSKQCTETLPQTVRLQSQFPWFSSRRVVRTVGCMQWHACFILLLETRQKTPLHTGGYVTAFGSLL